MNNCNLPPANHIGASFCRVLGGQGSVRESIAYASFGALLLLTAAAKLYGAYYGPEPALAQVDWVFQVQMRWVLLFAALLETVIATILFSSVGNVVKCVTGFAFFFWIGIYRVFRALLEGPDPNGCACLGYVTEVMGISNSIADTALIGLLFFGLIYFSLQLVNYGSSVQKRI